MRGHLILCRSRISFVWVALLFGCVWIVADARFASPELATRNISSGVEIPSLDGASFCFPRTLRQHIQQIRTTFSERLMVLTREQKESFIRDGYLVLRNVVPREMVDAALRVVDNAFAERNYTLNDHNKQDVVPFFNQEVEKAPEIYGTMSDTVLIEACEDLLGKGNVLYGKKAQIAFRPTDQRLLQNGMGMTEPMPKHRYHIDGGGGKYKKTASSFTLLVGVALSEGQDVDKNRGQLNVWPGSHKLLHPLLCERVKKGLIPPDGHNLFGVGPGKPDIGQPIRVLLRPGDACLAHQRLGHGGGINLHSTTRKNLYFRVNHKRHDDFLDQILQGCDVFTEYEGIRSLAGNK